MNRHYLYTSGDCIHFLEASRHKYQSLHRNLTAEKKKPIRFDKKTQLISLTDNCQKHQQARPPVPEGSIQEKWGESVRAWSDSDLQRLCCTPRLVCAPGTFPAFLLSVQKSPCGQISGSGKTMFIAEGIQWSLRIAHSRSQLTTLMKLK